MVRDSRLSQLVNESQRSLPSGNGARTKSLLVLCGSQCRRGNNRSHRRKSVDQMPMRPLIPVQDDLRNAELT